MTPNKPCPCGSGIHYGACCRPFHRGEREPETPGRLMRSRYSAFALSEVTYLIRTLHASHEDAGLPEKELQVSLASACRENRYMRLTILEEPGEDPPGTGRVRFVARVFHKGKDCSFEELSEFRNDGHGWRYSRSLEQIAPPTPR